LDFLGKKPEPKVAVFSLTYDRLELTKECFKSLYDTAGYEFDHYIVDNGSKDGTVEYLKELSNPNGRVITVLNPDNKGISIASNQALDRIKAEGDYQIIIKVDNDAYFKDSGWLPAMIKVWKVWPSLSLSLYVEGLLNNPGGAPRLDYLTVAGELIGVTKHIGGICHFVDATAYREFRWDENSFLHGVQDMEFSQHLTFDSFYMGYMENWYVEHRYGTKGQHERFKDYFERRIKERSTRYEKNRK
jgi:GT2 family glycosyltransferase